ncbi:MAG: M48 family metalloprotease [Archangiaceae bacterium]|nr:M48 family metalloprotease [Archangiaceae bacterium]
MTEAIFTAEQLAEIRAYHQPHYVWGALGEVVNLAVGLVMLRFVVRPLYARCERVKLPSRVLTRMWSGEGWAAALAFSCAYFAITTLLYLPLDVYFDYLHEHAYGLSKHTPASFALDYGKGVLISIAALGALTFGLFGLARRVRHWWALLGAAGAVVLLFSSALDPYRARIYFGQQPLQPGELRERITALMRQANIDFRDVLVEDNSRATVRLQAYFAGRGPTRTIVLNKSLLENLSTDEILAAVAHEAGHVSESRWPATFASAAALFAFLFAVDWLLRWVARRGFWGVTEPADIRALPLVLLVFGLCTAVAKPVSAAFSRERERQADQYGLTLTQHPDAFTSMLVKAARVNKMDPEPPWWVTLKGRTHPSIRERLDAVAAWRP